MACGEIVINSLHSQYAKQAYPDRPTHIYRYPYSLCGYCPGNSLDSPFVVFTSIPEHHVRELGVLSACTSDTFPTETMRVCQVQRLSSTVDEPKTAEGSIIDIRCDSSDGPDSSKHHTQFVFNPSCIHRYCWRPSLVGWRPLLLGFSNWSAV